MKTHLLIAIRITVLTLVLFGVIYPLAITFIARITTAHGGKGETLSMGSNTVGFTVIGQSFLAERYFHSRPSAVNYNAAATGGSNKAMGNPDYLAEVGKRVAAIRLANPDQMQMAIPADLVTASGGGLDPHISVAAARFQVARIARVRGVSPEVIERLIDHHTEGPLFGWFGPSYVHVLRLNMSLDQIQ